MLSQDVEIDARDRRHERPAKTEAVAAGRAEVRQHRSDGEADMPCWTAKTSLAVAAVMIMMAAGRGCSSASARRAPRLSRGPGRSAPRLDRGGKVQVAGECGHSGVGETSDVLP